MSLIDKSVGMLRPLQLRGKGRLLDLVTPHEGVRTVPVWGAYDMTLDLGNAIHRQIYMGCFGREMTVWTRALLPNGGTFLDVGAHIGYFTLLASAIVGSAGKVIAVEPNPAAYASLTDHLTRNRTRNVEAHNIALAAERGSLRLYTPPEGTLKDYNVTMMSRPGWTPVDVEALPLDGCLREWDSSVIDVMKIDVEGAEPLVFRGGVELLRSGHVRHIIAEVNGPRLGEGGSSPEKLVAQLAELGFKPARLQRGGALPVPVETWDLDSDHEFDRLFVHSSIL